MANYWKSPKCVILSWVYRLTLGYTRWKTFLAYFYSFCWFFEGLVANLDTKKVCFPNCFLCYMIRAVTETVSVTPLFSSRLCFPHAFSSWCEWKQAYLRVKYWIYSIRNSFGNNFCCDQSCRWCWTMLGKIKKIIITRRKPC